MSIRNWVKLETKIRALQRKQNQEIQNSVKHLHTAFHGRNAKVRLDVATAKVKEIKAVKLKKEKEEKEKLEKEKKEKK